MSIRIIVSLATLLAVALPSFATDLVVYSARKEHLIKPLFDAYTRETGVAIKYVTDKAGPLLQRLKAEGKNSPADLLITVDAGNLWHAANEGILHQVDSAILDSNVPSFLKDKHNRWFGLSLRARTIVYSTERVKSADLSTYEDLGNVKWKNRLILRTSKKVYNQSLVAMLIAEHGVEKTEKIVKAWVANLAAKPTSNDTKVMEAILAGQADVGIVNTYYFGRLLKKSPDLKLALYWPNQGNGEGGVHVNVSGAGVVSSSKNKAEAVKFIEWLSSEKAQNLYADGNMEYPVNPQVKPHTVVSGWGEFRKSPQNLTQAGELQVEAIKLMDRVGYR
jgi:iron(III) transport system substrate-binding protein